MRPRSCSSYSSSSSAYLLIAHLSSEITRQRELETSFRFFVVITGCNDNDNMMLVDSGRVGGGLRCELCHEQDGVQGDEQVDHISRTTIKMGMDMKTKVDP